jgi:hypothetical protein
VLFPLINILPTTITTKHTINNIIISFNLSFCSCSDLFLDLVIIYEINDIMELVTKPKINGLFYRIILTYSNHSLSHASSNNVYLVSSLIGSIRFKDGLAIF